MSDQIKPLGRVPRSGKDDTNDTNFEESALENIGQKQTEFEQTDSNVKITGDNENKEVEGLSTTCDNDKVKDTGSIIIQNKNCK